MIASGLWVAWAGAALWLGAALGWQIAAVPLDRRSERVLRADELAPPAWRMQRAGPTLALAGSLLVIGGVAAQVRSTGATLWMSGVAATLAAIVALLLVFHVERGGGTADRKPRIQPAIVRAITFTASLSAGTGIAGALAAQINAVVAPLAAFCVLVIGELLLALFIAVVLIILASRASPGRQRPALIAIWSRRWALGAEAVALVALAIALLLARALWHPQRLLAVTMVVVAGVLLLALSVGHLTLIDRLWGALATPPIYGVEERELGARHRRARRLSRRVLLLCGGTAVLALALAEPLVLIVAWPAPRQIVVIAPPATSTPQPTAASATPSGHAGASGGTLTQSSDGVTVTLTLASGSATPTSARFTVRNANGQAIPNATLALVVAPELLSQQGAAVAATADPDGKSGDFVATLPLTEAGQWQIVAVVTTPDQSVATSVVFTVSVGG